MPHQSAKTPAARQRSSEERSWSTGYSSKERPLGRYLALMGLLSVGLASGLASLKKKDSDRGLTWNDLLLLGVATHKLGRIATKDLVTSPFRAPFVRLKKSAGAGEVEEEARGTGFQEAIGDLITCPYCIAPWIASGLVFALERAPRLTRLFSSIFAVTAGSDFLNLLYARSKGK